MASGRNLIVIVAHGLRSDAVGDSQAWPLRTPAMEKLAARGLRVVADSACPADDGGRVSLLTGLHARQHGNVEPTRGPVAVTGWPSLLAEAGYHTAGVGVIADFEPWLDQAVYVENVHIVESSRCAYLTKMVREGYGPAVQMQRRQRQRFGPFEPDRLLIEPDNDIDGFIAVEARRLLKQMPTDRPWALIVSFTGPGNDLAPPTLYDGIVDPRHLEPGFTLADFTKLDAMAELDYPRILLQRLEPQKVGRMRADYLGRVSLIDHGIDRLCGTLLERPDAGKTWTVVCSDRGHLLGEHGLFGHRSFLCGAIETPFILAPPPPGSAVDEERFFDGLVSTIDVATTIAALGGCDMPHASPGRSLLPAMANQPVMPALHGGILSEFGRRLMLETERYKAIFDADARRAIGLYDLLNDPAEKTNMIDTPTGRNMIDALRWRLGDALLPLRAPVGGGAV